MTESQRPQKRGRKFISRFIDVCTLRHVSIGLEALITLEAEQIAIANRAVVDKYRQAAAIQLEA
jgi:hypothetical protein